jgi:hypothetical protein
MSIYADLEIGLHRRDATNYVVEMRFSSPQSDADIRLTRREPVFIQVDPDLLRSYALDPDGYGKHLSERLFASSDVAKVFGQARSVAQSLDVPLRLRLLIGPSAPELHSLRWETLLGPDQEYMLLTSETVLFSRYLSSTDWRPVRRKAKSDLRALVIVANPTNVSEYAPDGQPLASVDVAGELARAREGLGTIPITELASSVVSDPHPPTLNAIIDHLRDGYDILYLIGHGAMIKGEPYLWLEDEQGESAVTPGRELITQIRELQHRPMLVVLASCESAGSGEDARSSDEGVLAALGPGLAEAGIPSVLAMQGNVTMKTVATFMPVFFEELLRDGQIDRAVAVGRGAVRERHDWWVPVLFMRLKSGSLWYVPGFADDRPDFNRWPALLRHIRRNRCTPILGPDLTEHLLGSHQEIAQRWAETYNFPLEPHARDDLPQVAQYLAVNQGERYFPHEELQEYLRKELLRLYPDIPNDLQQAPLLRLLEHVGAHHRERNPLEPHRVLATMPFSTYITTNTDNLLQQAVLAAGKQPHVAYCPWNTYIERRHEFYDEEPENNSPLIYQLFGTIDDPETLVLTEDDYFDYLIGFTSNRDLIPGVVRRVLSDTALLFLGFRMDDWSFRVLFRSIMTQEGGFRMRDYTSIAVQIDPEDGHMLDPAGARRYLESYFQGASISIYWGRVEDFVGELVARMEKNA